MPPAEPTHPALGPWDRFVVWFECVPGRIKAIVAAALIAAALGLALWPSSDSVDAPPVPPGAPTSEGAAPAAPGTPVAPTDGTFIR